MLKFDRHKIIIEELEKNGSVQFSDLIKIIPASKITVQRDLIELEEEKRLTRVHGGAVLGQTTSSELIKSPNEIDSIEISRRLARKAVEFIRPDDTIAIDGNINCEFIADFIPDFPIMAVTSSTDSFKNLSKKQNIIPVLTGGKYSRDSRNLVGNFTVETIKKFSFSVLFLSAEGLDPMRGTLESSFDDYMVKIAFISVSEDIILLIDSSKINKTQGIFTCPIGKISKIITDAEPDFRWPPEVIKRVVVV